MTTTRPPFPHVIDSTLRSSFVSCPRKFELEYLLHWKPRDPSVHLHAGGAFAKGLEVAREAYFKEGQPPEDAVAQGMQALLESYGAFECPPDSAKSLERMLGAMEYYFDAYPLDRDAAIPITLPGGNRGIEFSFAEPIDILHPETGDPLIYCGRMDQVVEYAGGVFGEDDKTTSSLGASWSGQWDLRCFSADTELLTGSGWKRIDSLRSRESIAQWADGEISFVPAEDYHSASGPKELISIQGARVNQLVTGNHRIFLQRRRGGSKIVLAENLLQEDRRNKIPTSGSCSGEKLPKAIQQYVAAVQADGSLQYSKGKIATGRGHREHMPYPAVRFAFTKQRKRDRLRGILQELEVAFTEQEDSAGRFVFHISGFEVIQELLVKVLDGDKNFRHEQAELFDEIFLEELEHWDGWASQYYTSVESNARFVQTVAHLNGYRASVQLKNMATENYVVCLSKTVSVELQALTIKKIPYTGDVWCVSVPSGLVMTRRGGVISVSGNSQFTGYTWACQKAGIPLQGFLVRGISILKTKYDTQQAITYRPQWQLDRWYKQLLRDISRMIECWKEGYFDYNLDHACGEFGGCVFKRVCLAENPQPWLETSFERRIWNPLTRIEEKAE